MTKTTLPQPLTGIIPPMVTPLLDNDALDVEGLDRLIEHILSGGVHGLFILGTTGEGPSLSYHLRHELVERTCRQVAGRVPVLVGITDTVFSESIRLAHKAAECGAAAVVAAPPYYFAGSQAELIAYFQHLAEQVPLPLLLYNMPQQTKVSLETATVQAIAEHPNVVGLKDSSANSPYFQLVKHAMKERPYFTVLVGPEEVMAEVVLLGGHGGVNGGANLFPELYVALYKAVKEQNSEEIMVLQSRVLEVSSRIYSVSKSGNGTLKSLKCALSLMGICNEYLAEPLQPLTSDERNQILRYLEETGVVISQA